MELSLHHPPAAEKKPPMRAEERLLLSRTDAAQLLCISQRALDYLVATRRLPTRRIGKRVLIPLADLRKYHVATVQRLLQDDRGSPHREENVISGSHSVSLK